MNTLGDLFWKNTFDFSDDYHEETIQKLRKFAREEYDLNLSYLEAYELWSIHSDSYCASWLCYREDYARAMLDYIIEEGKL